MKTLSLILLCSSFVYADQAANSFGTGFANALQRALEARQGQQTQATTSYAQPSKHFSAVDNYGNQYGQFVSYDQCVRFVQNSQVYRDCVLVQE